MNSIGYQIVNMPNLQFTIIDIWCFVAILCLPLNNIVGFDVIGIHFNLIEFLMPLQLFLFIVLATRLSFKMPAYQFRTGIILLVLLFYQLNVVIYVHNEPLSKFVKIASGQAFVFFIYILFSRVSPALVSRYLETLVWMGAIVTLGSIGLVVWSGSLRLDSPFWGRTNAFASALLVLVVLGFIILILFKRNRILIPTLVNTIGIILTQSRSVFLILFLALGLLWIMHNGRRGKLVTALVILLSIGLLWMVIGSETLKGRISILERMDREIMAMQNFIMTRSEYDKRQIMSGRLYFWESAFDTISKHPIWGTADLPIYIPKWAGSELTKIEREGFTYHSWLLNITAKYGVIGMIMNFLVLISGLSPYWKYRKKREAKLLIIVLGVLLLHGMVEPIFEGGFFASNIQGLLFWTICGLSYRVITIPEACKVVLPSQANMKKSVFSKLVSVKTKPET